MTSVDIRTLMLTGDVQKGWTYFISGSAEDGYRFELCDRLGNTLCASATCATRSECLVVLRKVQRHAASTHVIDESTQ